MGLGRTTRFAPLPPGARRVSVMRLGAGGLPVLAPSPRLLDAFMRRKRALVEAGMEGETAHGEAFRQTGYRERFRAEIRSRPAALGALRRLIDESKAGDLYLMCMCPYRAREEACHTYLLLELARELDPTVRLLPEPAPAPRKGRRPTGRPARGRTPPARSRDRSS